MGWIIEKAVFPADEEQRLLEVLASGLHPYEIHSDTDLKRHLPDLADDSVVRGSCWLFRQLQLSSHWRRDLWGSEQDFACQSYSPRYAEFLLNTPCSVVSFHELCWKRSLFLPESESAIFVRPDSGLKLIDGQVVTGTNFEAWHENCRILQLRGDTPLIVAATKSVLAEYRCVVIDGQVAGSSQYRPALTCGCPRSVQLFVESVTMAVTPPCRVYVVDVAETSDGLFVLEVGCFCCVALYDCDLIQIVEQIARVVR